MGFWSDVDIYMQEGMTKEEAIFKLTGENTLTIHEAAVHALKGLSIESDYLDIYEYIIEKNLFVFGAKKEKHEVILKRIIERKCINSNLSYKTKELLFYKRNSKYGLLEWLNQEEINALNKNKIEDKNKKELTLIDIDEKDTNKSTHDDIETEREEKILNEKSRLAIQIQNLEEKLKKEAENKTTLKKENEVDKEILIEYEKEIQILKEEKDELIKYEKEIDKIKSAINILKNPATDLQESKRTYIKYRDKFSDYADKLFYVSMSMFVLIICIEFISFGLDVFSKKTEWSLYLIMVFPVIFPAFLSFLFTRQSNIKSIEIEKINKRFILIHEVNQALEALVEINRGKDMDGKTERIIDKLINNILDFASDNNENTNQKNDLLELNNKLDSFINTFKTKIDAGEIIQK